MRKFAALILALSLLLAACGGDDGSEEGTATTAAAGDTTATTQETQPDNTAAPDTSDAPETTSAPGTTGATTDAGSSLLAAIAQSEQATSGRMEGTFVITGAEGMPTTSEIAISFSGEFAENGDSTFIMDMSDIAGAAPAGEEIPAEFADLFGEMEVRTIGDTSYMRFGMFAMLGVETPWVSMPATDADSTAASFGANPVNPADIMSSFGPGVSEAENLGTEDIRGVPTTHFQVLVDVEAMMEAADEETLAELEGIGTTFPTGLMPVDFWIGEDGNIYRFSMTFDGTLDPESPFVQMEMIWEMYDYGAAIQIATPPESDVTDGSDLAVFFTG